MGLSALFILAPAAVLISICFGKCDGDDDESYEDARFPSSQAGSTYGRAERPRTDYVRPQNTHATQVYAPTDHSRVQSTYAAPTQARPQPLTEYHGVQSSRTYTAPIPSRPQPPTNIRASRAQSTYVAPMQAHPQPPTEYHGAQSARTYTALIPSRPQPPTTYASPEPPTPVRPDVHVAPPVPSSRIALGATHYDFSVYEEDSRYMPEPISPGADVSHQDFNATQRAPAKRAYDRMRDAQTMRKQAYKRGDRREAEQLSIVIKQRKEEAERLNTTAAERIFKGESNANVLAGRTGSNQCLFGVAENNKVRPVKGS